jgi:hypothetical protein
MRIDTAALAGLMEESCDLHVDAMRATSGTLAELEDVGAERQVDVGPDEVHRFDAGRRQLLARLGLATGVAGLGSLLGVLLAAPARADTALDVQILQTASSLEALAVAVYGRALGTGPDLQDAPAYKALAAVATKSAKDTLVAFLTETMRQHGDHKKAFQAQTVALDRNAKVQDAPNPKILALVNAADVSTVQKLVDFAALFEKVATDTYLLGLTMLADTGTKALLAGAMAVEAQHVAGLRAVGALLKADAPQLVNVPFPAADLAKLPSAVGNIGFPDSLEKVNGADLIAEPTSGAVN